MLRRGVPVIVREIGGVAVSALQRLGVEDPERVFECMELKVVVRVAFIDRLILGDNVPVFDGITVRESVPEDVPVFDKAPVRVPVEDTVDVFD